MRNKLKLALGVLGTIALVCLISGLIAHERRPVRGRTGDDAEALTRYFEDASGSYGWERTGAISFRFFAGNTYLWDRQRHFVSVKWGDTEVQLPLDGGQAVIREDGREVRDADDRRRLRDRAYRVFLNDSFWLNPFGHLRDPGVTRSVILREGRAALLVEFSQGGHTPGDAYVFMTRQPHVPMRWAMWVSVLPVGGIENTWEWWQTLGTGAKVSRWHAKGGLGIVMFTDVRAAPTLAELVPGADPFADLARQNPPR